MSAYLLPLGDRERVFFVTQIHLFVCYSLSLQHDILTDYLQLGSHPSSLSSHSVCFSLSHSARLLRVLRAWNEVIETSDHDDEDNVFKDDISIASDHVDM